MAGVIAWIADARRNYFKAKELQTHKNNKKFKERYHKKFKMWEKRRKKLDMTLRYGFIVSVFIYTFVIIAYLVSLK
ncbi:hypothetical protein JCM19294_849 [Nonlabens tegetincola]|uniref:Uncharacterized protein n=2 Tax=Nonlabens tegetincola TaxID=323273 RepID=A0A090QRU3_9FLAO|nr:hypothetical protein JCM19294_849 [Nonlabens tegetincola]